MLNLFADIDENCSVESVLKLARGKGVRIERIVSHGQASPEGFWYDQVQAEWVAVLEGEAKIRLEGVDLPVSLKAGDSILIPAHQRHRVDWSAPNQRTVWLAVFFDELQADQKTLS